MKEPPENGLTWTTYPEQLQAAGITWKVYGSVTTAAGGGSNMNGAFQTYRQANVNLAAYGAPTAPYTPGSEAISPLYQGIGNTMPDGGFLAAMAADIAAGTLPQVSWVHAPMRA
jgi:phospholipase C